MHALAAQIFAETDCAECPPEPARWGVSSRRKPEAIGAVRERRSTLGGYRWGERKKKPAVKWREPRARKSEVRLVDFCRGEMKRCGVSRAVIYERLMAGKYPGAKLRRPHRKFVFVTPPAVLPGDVNVPADLELPLKVYVAMEAARLRMTERAVYVRIYRGRYPGLEFRRVNQRVVFVKAKKLGDRR